MVQVFQFCIFSICHPRHQPPIYIRLQFGVLIKCWVEIFYFLFCRWHAWPMFYPQSQYGRQLYCRFLFIGNLHESRFLRILLTLLASSSFTPLGLPERSLSWTCCSHFKSIHHCLTRHIWRIISICLWFWPTKTEIMNASYSWRGFLLPRTFSREVVSRVKELQTSHYDRRMRTECRRVLAQRL